MRRVPFCFAKLYDDIGLGLTYFNCRILLNTRNKRTYSVITHGRLEPAVCALFEKLIQPGDAVVDVGANIGFLTLLACKLSGPEGRVVAFEPNPDVHELLQSNVEINAFRGWCETRAQAVDRCAGHLRLTWNPHQEESGRVVSEQMQNLAQKNALVEAVSLDEALGDARVDLLKIDTEGCEQRVLEGATGVIERNPGLRVIMEWNPRHIEQRDGDPAATAAFIFQHFGRVEQINRIDELTPLSAAELPNLNHCNLLLSEGKAHT